MSRRSQRQPDGATRDSPRKSQTSNLESQTVGKLFFNKKLGEIFRCKCRMCEVRVENSMATAWLYFTSLSDNDLPNLAWFIQSRYGMNPNFSTVHFYESNGFIRNLSLRSSQRHRIMQRKWHLSRNSEPKRSWPSIPGCRAQFAHKNWRYRSTLTLTIT